MTNRENKDLELYNDFINSSHNVLSDVQRFVTQMRECDFNYQKMMSKIENLSKNFDGFESKAYTETLTKLLVTGLDIGDKKVKTVQHMSDLVDDKVRCLENGRKNLISTKKPDAPKRSIKEKPESSNWSKERCIPSTSTVSKELKKHNADNDSNESSNDAKDVKRLRRNGADEPDNKDISDDVVVAVTQRSNIPLPRSTATALVLSHATLKKTTQKTKSKNKGKYKKQQDNPPSLDDNDHKTVDPDEPTYCLCDQISYGEMICCDNDLCPIEWFHFLCVSLSTKPKGKWFCPKCRGHRSNIMKPKMQFFK